MSDQLTLPYQSHSIESREAAESIKAHAQRLRDRVLDLIARFGPITDNEIISALGTQSARPRRIELERMGLIYKSGTVKQPNGRSAAVWRVVSTVQGHEFCVA